MANEDVDSILRSNRGSILCKLDLEKAYDHVDMFFFLWCWKRWALEQMDWVDQVVHFYCRNFCVDKWNPRRFFRNSRGLRQGDPLSPYLFVIMMEAFTHLVQKAVRRGFLTACHMGGRGGKGAEISQEHMTYLCWLLIWFEALSRLRLD